MHDLPDKESGIAKYLPRMNHSTDAAAMNQPQLILASKSPRRRELLSIIGIPFSAVNANVDEAELTQHIIQKYNNESFSSVAANIVMGLAKAKAQSVLRSNPDSVVIGSDTIVTVDTSILGKPTSTEDALRMLRLLSGKDHYVYTGVSILTEGREETFYTVTCVSFYPWSRKEEELALKYIETGLPMDKAGAYGIQDMGALFISEIKGDYYTVMGLPVAEVYRRLMNFGV